MNYSKLVWRAFLLIGYIGAAAALGADDRPEDLQMAPFINIWQVSGPFDTALDAADIAPAVGDSLNGMNWEYLDDRLWNRNYDNYVDLSGYYRVRKGIDTRNRYVYAATSVFSPHDQQVELRFGTSGTNRLFLNGELLQVNAEPREVQRDIYSQALDLQQGWNQILLEIHHDYTRDTNENGAYIARDAAVSYLGLYARVSDEHGNRVPGVLYAVEGDLPELTILAQALAADDVVAAPGVRGRGLPTNTLPVGYREWPYVWNTTLYPPIDNRRIWADPYQFQAGGGMPGYSWKIVAGNLPDGLTLDRDGRIWGWCQEIGEFGFTIEVADSAGNLARKELSIEVRERPTRWFELGRVSGLTHVPPVYNFWVDPNYSADLWAERARNQGHHLVTLESQQQNYYWPSEFDDPQHPRNRYQPRDEDGQIVDGLMPYVDALRRHGMRLGIYMATEGGGLRTFSSDAFVQIVSDLVHRYDPIYFYFDGPQFLRDANYDMMFSAVRNYGDDIIVNSNVWSNHGEYGDADLGTSEAKHIYQRGEPARFNKRVIVEPWKTNITKNNFNPHYPKRDDFRQVVKEMIMNPGRGLVDNNDQMPLQHRGPNFDPAVRIAEVYPIAVQEFTDLRESHAAWFAPQGKPNRLPAIAGTDPYFLSGWGYEDDGEGNIAAFAAGRGPSWGYAMARDNKIYLNMVDGPDGKTGYRGEDSISIEPVPDSVLSVRWLNEDRPLEFNQVGKTLTIDMRDVGADPICTIVEITTDNPARKFTLTNLDLSAMQSDPGSLRVIPDAYSVYPALKVELKPESLSFASDAPEVATVDAHGRVSATAPGRATIEVEYQDSGVTASNSIGVLVDNDGNLRVDDELIGIVLRVAEKEAYLKTGKGEVLEYTLAGRAQNGGPISLHGAEININFGVVDYTKAKNHQPVYIEAASIFEVEDGSLITAEVEDMKRAAVWAEVELDGVLMESNRVFVDVEPARRHDLAQAEITSSGHIAGYAPELVADGITIADDGSDSSKWSTRSDQPAWLAFDFGAPRQVSEIRIHWNTLEQRYHNTPGKMEVQASDDGISWRTMRVFTPPAHGQTAYFGFTDDYPFRPTEMRHLRLVFPENQSATAQIDLLEAIVLNNSVYNLAMLAKITASSIYNEDYAADNVADGIIGRHGAGEWSSADEADPWIRMDWDEPVTISRIVFHDRPNPNDHMRQGVLSFSEGSGIEVLDIPVDGSAKVVEFPARKVEWIKFEGRGNAPGNNGFSEIIITDRQD